MGNPQGGVKAPEPLLLPDPRARFAVTAARLRALAYGHSMEGWLRFMAAVADAQHEVAVALAALAAPDLAHVRQAVEARLPPLAADGHGRDPVWREGLAVLLGRGDDGCCEGAIPEPARAVMRSLRARDAAAVEALADGFLSGEIDGADAGPALYVAAALQAYFTALAAKLPAAELRLLPERGLCPCCGSTPVAGVVTASGPTPGTRYLHCSLCATAWNHVRAMCVTCGKSRRVTLIGIEGDTGAVKAEACGDCHSYAKMLYQQRDMKVDPVADDLASLGLDLLAAEAGWRRHAPNPLLLIG
jgi:FdhE protein